MFPDIPDIESDDGRPARAVRKENDFYPTPVAVIRALVERWPPGRHPIWEPCSGDGRVAEALRRRGHAVEVSDIQSGQDFFFFTHALAPVIVTNPPFSRIREFIDHAFAIGVQGMALVCPERLWACAAGRRQFERHRPTVWANLDWREDYLGRGGSPDRALAVAIWDSPCAERCDFQVWAQPTDQPELFRSEQNWREVRRMLTWT